MSFSTNRRLSKPVNKLKSIKSKPGSKLKVQVKKNIPVSPSQGVPPPEDLKPASPSDQFNTSNSFVDVEAIKIKRTTEALSKEIKSKLLEYKDSNKTHLQKKQEIDNQVNLCKSEFKLMTNSIGDIITEAHRTKEELKFMREKIELESMYESEYSSINYQRDPVLEKLDYLKNSIFLMNQRLSNTEKTLEMKSTENNELKNTLFKLKETISGQVSLEQEENHPNCEICGIV
jgi:chromosome segregation ATPase